MLTRAEYNSIPNGMRCPSVTKLYESVIVVESPCIQYRHRLKLSKAANLTPSSTSHCLTWHV